MILSVIIPVYNGEKYLKDCLLSLVNQKGGGYCRKTATK